MRIRLPVPVGVVVGRKVDVDQLVGAEEIAERLGLSGYQRVHELRRRNPDFPAPVAQTKRTMIWSWPDVEGWWKNRNKRLNR